MRKESVIDWLSKIPLREEIASLSLLSMGRGKQSMEGGRNKKTAILDEGRSGIWAGKNGNGSLITWEVTGAWGDECLKDLQEQEWSTPPVYLNHSKVWQSNSPCAGWKMKDPKEWNGMQALPHSPADDPSAQEAEAYWGVNVQPF